MAVVLVTGASGALGPQVVQALHQAGHRVRAFCRQPPQFGLFPEGVESVRGDVTDLRSVQEALRGVELVLHLAGLLHISTLSADLHRAYEAINVGGTSTVARSAAEAGVRRLVLFSTIAVYGPTQGQYVREDSPVNPTTYYARTKLAAEKIVLSKRRKDGQPLGVVLRLAATYGSRIKGNYRRLVKALENRWFVPIGNGGNRRTVVYDKDLAQAAMLAMLHPRAAGRIYNVTDGQVHTVAEINTAICRALGRRAPSFFLPVGPIRLAASFMEDVFRLAGLRCPVDRATIDKYVEDVAVDGRLVQSELGFTPEYGLDAGWCDAVVEMREQGVL